MSPRLQSRRPATSRRPQSRRRSSRVRSRLRRPGTADPAGRADAARRPGGARFDLAFDTGQLRSLSAGQLLVVHRPDIAVGSDVVEEQIQRRVYSWVAAVIGTIGRRHPLRRLDAAALDRGDRVRCDRPRREARVARAYSSATAPGSPAWCSPPCGSATTRSSSERSRTQGAPHPPDASDALDEQRRVASLLAGEHEGRRRVAAQLQRVRSAAGSTSTPRFLISSVPMPRAAAPRACFSSAGSCSRTRKRVANGRRRRRRRR